MSINFWCPFLHLLVFLLSLICFLSPACLRSCGHLHAGQVNIARVARTHKLARANQPIIRNGKICTRWTFSSFSRKKVDLEVWETIFFNCKNTWKGVRRKCYQLQHQAMLRNHLALKYSTERNWVTLGRSLCVEPLVYNQTDGMIWFSEQRLWNWMIPWGDKIKLAFWENRAWSFPLGCDRCDYAQPTIRHRHENSLRNRACPILNQGPLYLPN